MTIAQRIESLQEPEYGASTTIEKVAMPANVHIMRLAAALQPGIPPRNEMPATARQESEVAIKLLNEVTNAFPAVIARCEQLEATVVSVREHARGELEAAKKLASEWQQAANVLKQQVDNLEKSLQGAKHRAEVAEGSLASMRDLVDRSQHAAAEAECLSSLFQDRVISSFGIGSVMHPILENLRAKTGAHIAG